MTTRLPLSNAASLAPLFECRDISVTFRQPRTARDLLSGRNPLKLHALRNVSLAVKPGEILGVVGESGCGKSTLGRTIAGLQTPDSGELLWEGRELAAGGDRKTRARNIQMVFQDPYASLNPRMTLGQMLDEVLHVHGLCSGTAERRERVDELLLMVGLAPQLKDRMPHAISGGQRQRVSIARALAVEPRLLIADEPVSALDASVQAQIINLLEDLRTKLGIAILFVAHDLNVVRHISDRVTVMYLGEILESAPADALFDTPRHPYTQGLLEAIPLPDPQRRKRAPSVTGELPDPLHPPAGCSFSSRCPHAVDACKAARPALERCGAPGEFREARCIRPLSPADAPVALGHAHCQP
ncbi:ABC transporter ATP-binding protein [Burkholderia vietnamiensis]|uniref:ABC transporter ATP-binding protein n=1 Tax=Burkholderia vietnamiensis TaxID=60552 RepID=UPI00158A15AA|nr:oligopeptide/dipeptide ABC transporter ATP-binding protein [Burkholderia vietnamiensis]